MSTHIRYGVIKDALWKDITNGTLCGRLPTEPVLAERYGVSRMTLRRAIKALVEEGFLYARQGYGTFVCDRDRPAAATTGGLGFLLAPDIPEHIDDPYFGALFRSLCHAAVSHDRLVVAGRHWEDLAPPNPLPGDARPRRRVDGIVACGFGLPAVASLATCRLPLVLLDSAPAEGHPCILPDNRTGVTMAMELLTRLGHRRIAHISGPDDNASARERCATWRQMVNTKSPESLLVSGDFTVTSGYDGMRALWQREAKARPTAVMAANDRTALGALRFLQEQGVRVPHDISLVGFDDVDAAQHTYPTLTTLRVDRRLMATTAIDQLMVAIGGRAASLPAFTAVPVRLVERESTAPPRAAAKG